MAAKAANGKPNRRHSMRATRYEARSSAGATVVPPMGYSSEGSEQDLTDRDRLIATTTPPAPSRGLRVRLRQLAVDYPVVLLLGLAGLALTVAMATRQR